MTTVDAVPAGPREWVGLGLLAVACVLFAMNLTVLGVAVPAISAELQPSSAQLLWILDIYGFRPVEVALPLHVADDLHAPGTLLGLYWTLFGAGAVLGGLAVGALRQLPLWPVMVAIVIGWGLTLLPFGFDAPTPVTVACFTLGGAIYGPFVALSVTLMQATSPPQHLPAMLAARSAALLTASPLGTALGGPLTTALGPRATLGGSGLATVVLGLVACMLLAARGRRQ